MATKKSTAEKKATIKIRQVGSPISCKREHRDALRGLGLRRIRHTVERVDTPAVRGMIKKVDFLVEIVED